MVDQTDPRLAYRGPATTKADGAVFDAGLRKYMLSVYNYMASGVLLTGIVALLVANNVANGGFFLQVLAGGGLMRWVVMLAPLAFVMVLSFGINRLSTAAAQGLFWAFAAVMGVSMASIFLVFTGESVAKMFFITSGAFAALSLWGYTTKKDLSGIGTFLIMGLFGLIIASLVNIFLQSGPMQFVISIVGVLVFAGLTAYDTQKIKSMYFHVAGTDFVGKSVVMGALSLYLDFVNMFTFLLQLFGNRE